MSIYAICHTNLDGWEGCSWPDRFVEIPRIGDNVQEVAGSKFLMVCKVTHCQFRNNHSLYPKQPYIDVELTRRTFP